MNKLSLLQEEAKTEKERLQQQALENGQKEKALNQYQQMVRNIINANMIAKTRIKKRDDVIWRTGNWNIWTIDRNCRSGKNLAAKKRQIQEGESKIAEANQALEKRMKQLREAYKSQEISKEIRCSKTIEEENNKQFLNCKMQIASLCQVEEISSKLSHVSGDWLQPKVL